MSDLIGQAGLTGIVLIDIGIGVIFAILTFSLIASALQEAIAGVLNFRGEHLRRAILRLIDGTHKPQKPGDGLKTLGRALLDHAAIRGLKGPKNLVQKVLYHVLIPGDAAADKDRMPSSIPKRTFARALVETLVEHKKDLEAAVRDGAVKLDETRDTIDKVIDGLAIGNRAKARLKALVQVDFSAMAKDLTATVDGAMDTALDEASRAAAEARRAAVAAVNAELAALERELAQWFDDAMDRVTGWYVRRAKTMLFAIGFVMTSAVGFDVIGYGQQLARDEALRSAIVAEANATVATGRVASFAIDGPDLNRRALEARQKQDRGEVLTDADQRALDAVSAFSAQDDANPDEISPEEAAAAQKTLRAAFDVVEDKTSDAITAINQTFADRGVSLSTPLWRLWGDWLSFAQLLLSAMIIGLGCTLGGQFWFDLLRTFLKVRAGASGIVSDRKGGEA